MSEETAGQKKMTPLRAIRAKCVECCCDVLKEIRLCPAKECPLHSFRMGRNPSLKRSLSDDEKTRIAERLADARTAKAEDSIEPCDFD